MIILSATIIFITSCAKAESILLASRNNNNSIVYQNAQTNEISKPYADQAYVYSHQHENIFVSANDPNYVKYIVIQPIFKSSPKVWILIQRDFDIPFPGLSSAESKFTSENNLYLVKTVKIIDDPRAPVADKTEKIPIDYSIFEKLVTNSTCYAMPENHKLRLCTAKEAKLRTPALKVFLGEH